VLKYVKTNPHALASCDIPRGLSGVRWFMAFGA